MQQSTQPERHYIQQHDPDILSSYVHFTVKAIRYRDGSRDESESESVRTMRRNMMRFYAKLALIGMPLGMRGSIWRKTI